MADVPNLEIEVAIDLSTIDGVDVEVQVGGVAATSATLDIDLSNLLDGGLLSFQVILPCVGGGFVVLTVTDATVAISGTLSPPDLDIEITGTVDVNVQCTDFIDCGATLDLQLEGELDGEVDLPDLSLSVDLTGDLGDTSLECCVGLLPQ